jgi:hypothetical protein
VPDQPGPQTSPSDKRLVSFIEGRNLLRHPARRLGVGNTRQLICARGRPHCGPLGTAARQSKTDTARSGAAEPLTYGCQLGAVSRGLLGTADIPTKIIFPRGRD